MKKIFVNEKIEFEKLGINERDDIMAYNGLTEEVILLNSTAYDIVKLIKKFGFAENVISEIEKEYDVNDKNRTQIHTEIKEIIKELVKNNVLKYEKERK